VPIVNILQQQQTTFLASDATEASTVARAFAADGSTWLVRGTLGVQWDATPTLSLGLMAETPTARLWGSSFYSDQRTRSFGTGFETVEFRDPNARMEYKLPFLLSGGAALRLGKVQVEANARWYGKVNEFDLYSSDSVGIALAQVEGGPPVRETVTLEPVPMAFGSIVNIFLGASMPVSQNWRVHLGFSTDQSPLTDTETIFREVNLIGGTAGVSFRISRVSGALGLGFQSGKSPTTTVGVEPTVVDTKLTVKTFQLLYSLAVTF